MTSTGDGIGGDGPPGHLEIAGSFGLGTLYPGLRIGAGSVTWSTALRSPELNRADRDGHAAGYYEGLIGGGHGSDTARDDASQRLIGKPSGWIPFQGCRCRSLSRRRLSSIRAQAAGGARPFWQAVRRPMPLACTTDR